MNNPLSDLAEEKFKEVQEAYDQIMKQRRMEDILEAMREIIPEGILEDILVVNLILPAVRMM